MTGPPHGMPRRPDQLERTRQPTTDCSVINTVPFGGLSPANAGTLYWRRASKWASRNPRSEAGSWSSRAKVVSPAPVSNSANRSTGQL